MSIEEEKPLRWAIEDLQSLIDRRPAVLVSGTVIITADEFTMWQTAARRIIQGLKVEQQAASAPDLDLVAIEQEADERRSQPDA